MMNIDNNNTTWFNPITYFFIGLFLITLAICFYVFAYFKWFKGKKLFKINILIINCKINMESLQIKNKY